MGYAISWIAVKGKEARTIHEELGLISTGQRESVPEAPILGAELPMGWNLVWANDVGFVDALLLGQLSAGAEIVTCVVEEHVMFIRADGWRDGKQMWSVMHDAQQGIDHLDVMGELPAEFVAIRDQLAAEQRQAGDRRDVDFYFDIPVQLAGYLTRFRHDGDFPGASDNDEPYEILEPIKGGAAAKLGNASDRKGCVGGLLTISFATVAALIAKLG